MIVNQVDIFARRLAEGTSRRGSLLTMGGAGLAALTSLSTTGSAKKKHKKDKNKNKKNDKQCQQQEAECNAFFAPLCLEVDPEENCVERLAQCCQRLRTCEVAAFLTCFLEVTQGG